MKRIAVSVLTLAASVRADVVAINSDVYVISESGPVLGHAIVSVYSQAAAYFTKLGKEVATVNLAQTEGGIGRRASATLQFECASKSTRCGHLVPEGASVDTSTLDMTLKDGTVVHYKRCSDAELAREPPPP
jgi:hypothetical protein